MLEKNAKIFIAGHRGLVGSAIWNNLQQRGYTNLVGRSHKELDLLDGTAVKKFFDEERPEAVVLAAAHVGGIMANLPTLSTCIAKSITRTIANSPSSAKL
jgi:GDP-L-fucose synthase